MAIRLNEDLYDAACRGDVCATHTLLDLGADPNWVLPGDGASLLMATACKGHVDVVKLLIECGADPYSSDPRGENALTYAAYAGNDELVRMFQCIGLPTTLEAAALLGDCEAINRYYAAGKDIDPHSLHGSTPLLSAAGKGHLEAVRLLVNLGADLSAADESGDALDYAASGGHTDVISLLVELGMRMDSLKTFGLLAQAARRGQVDTIRKLLPNIENANVCSSDGSTLLMVAAKSGQEEVVKLLLDIGADINLTDSHGRTALDHAKKSKHGRNVAELLKPKGN